MDLTITRQTVQSQVVEMLREAILAGHFKPGERLVESRLCALTKVSRTSIREALRHLEAERLVTFIPNRGPMVAQMSWKEAQEVYKVRALLEGEAAALFAERATDEEKRDMRAALTEFQLADRGGDAVGRVRASSKFYQVMLQGCGNGIIEELLTGLLARINFLRARSMSQHGRSAHSLQELERLLSSVEANDPEAARTAATDHIQAAAKAAQRMSDETHHTAPAPEE